MSALKDDGAAAGAVNREKPVKKAADGGDHLNGTDTAAGSGGEGTSSGQGTSGARAAARNVSVVPRRSKSEKRARKTLAGLELKPFPNVNRVLIRTTHNVLFTIFNPEVYKNPTSDSYVVFGEYKMEDKNQQDKVDLAQSFKPPSAMNDTPFCRAIRNLSIKDKCDDQENDSEIDYMGVDKKDVEIVCEQLNVSKQTAIDALLRNNNDIVNTIMELTEP